MQKFNWQFTCTWSSLLSKNSKLQQIFVFYIPPSFHFQLWFEKLMAPLRSLLEIESAFDHIFSGYNRCNLAKASFQPEKATRLNLKFFFIKFTCSARGGPVLDRTHVISECSEFPKFPMYYIGRFANSSWTSSPWIFFKFQIKSLWNLVFLNAFPDLHEKFYWFQQAPFINLKFALQTLETLAFH